MKILQVCPRYYPAYGGIEEYVRNLSERLARKHEVTVFTCDPSGKLEKEEDINGVLVRRFDTIKLPVAYYFSSKMARELKKFSFDIVHGHCYHSLPLPYCKNVEADKLVISPYYHGYGHTRRRNLLLQLYKPFGQRIFSAADVVIANSSFEKRVLQRDFGLSADKIVTVFPGINLSDYEGLHNVSKVPGAILTVGRLEEYKGIQHIIRTLPLLTKEFHLNIVGEGPYKAKLLELARRLGIEQKIKFFSNLSRQELSMMYAQAELYITLSRHETYALSVAEALASGTPCIVANSSALKEWIDFKNCFGINYPINRSELADMIADSIGITVDDAKLQDWNDVAAKIAEIYGLE